MEKTNEEKTLVFVYGTLKRGGYYNGYFKNSRFVKTATIKGTLYLRKSWGYPVLKLDGDCDIQGEIFEIDQATLKRLDGLEDFPNLYQRKIIKTQDGTKALVYYSEDYKSIPKIQLELIPNGNFKVVR